VARFRLRLTEVMEIRAAGTIFLMVMDVTSELVRAPQVADSYVGRTP
jgi:hypothetical protein